MKIFKIFLILLCICLLCGSAQASVSYSSSVNQISISNEAGNARNLTWLTEQVNNQSVLKIEDGVAYLNATIRCYNDGELYINSSDCSELIISNWYNTRGFYNPSKIYLDDIKITGWNYTVNSAMGINRTVETAWTSDPNMETLCAAHVRNCTFEGIAGLSFCYANNSDNYNITMINCTGPVGYGLYIKTLENISLHDITFSNCRGTAITAISSENISVYDVTVDNAGNYKTPTTGQFAIWYQDTDNSTIHDVSVNGTGWSAIGISPYSTALSEYITVYNCTVINAGHNSLDLHGCRYVDAWNLTLSDSISNNIIVTFSGGYINGTSEIFLHDIWTYHHGIPYGQTSIGSGILIGAEACNVTVQNYTADGDGAGINAQSLDNLSVYNMTTLNTSSGMSWTKSNFVATAYTYNGSLIDSDVSRATSAGINIFYSRNSQIINTNYNLAKAVFGTSYSGEGTVQYYGDFVVKDSSGNLLNGTITLSNTTGNYTGTDAAGKNKSTFTFTGRSALPSDRSNSIAIPEFYKNTSLTTLGTRINYVTIANISTDTGNVQLDNITPSSQWRRINPEQSTYTITAIVNNSEGLHFTGFAPSAEYNNYTNNSIIKMQVWANEPLTNVVWKVDEVEKQNGTATTYESMVGTAPIKVDLTGSTATETISKSWIIL